MEIIIGWIVFSVVVGVVAASRNRSVVGWVLLSLLISPLLALILLAFLGKPSPSSGPTKICPDCGRACPVSAVMCGGCDHDFSAPVPSDTMACPFCAEDIKIAAKLCKHCGREVVKV